jgi:hypothetical protein
LPGRHGEPLIQRPGALLIKRLLQLLALLLEIPLGPAAAAKLHDHRGDQGKEGEPAVMTAAMT